MDKIFISSINNRIHFNVDIDDFRKSGMVVTKWDIKIKQMESTEEERQQEFSRAMEAWDEIKRKRAIKALFQRSGISCDITDYNYFIRAFCWIKTLICLLLDRTNGSYMDSNKFCILSYDERHNLESIDWDACWVSPYLFKDWNVCLASDGT